ncbi:MAG: hypothetical protein VX727_03495 [Planctomycetota bacterium]|nr:hypothetical protein [Planctomycetota bacterium]
MIDHESRHDELLLGWVEETLDAEDRAVVDGMIAANPELGRTLESMRRHRRLAGELVDPPVPSDLESQVERVVARPMLSRSAPGQYRRRNRPSMSLAWLRPSARIAAMFLCGFGLLAAIVLLNPLQLFAPTDAPEIVRDPDLMRSFSAQRSAEQPIEADTPEVYGGSVVAGLVVDPEPLALVLPSSDEDTTLSLLRMLAMRTDATLLVNGSPADLLDPALEASASGGSRGSGEPPLLMEIEGVLLGDASLVPTMSDQFAYAEQGAIWTVTITLERFEVFLQVLDEVVDSEGELVLLDDHLDPEVAGGDWTKTLRARDRWRQWSVGDGTTMIEIPVFLAPATERD